MAFIAIDARADVTGSKKGKLTPAQHAQLNAWCLASKTGILDCLDKCEAYMQSYAASNNEVTIKFKAGYIVICGRLIECEDNTTFIMRTPTSGTQTGKIILRYNLANFGNSEFVITTKTGDLIQNDLNDNPSTGIYEFELYSYNATSSSVVLTRTNTDYIPDINEELKPLQGYNTEEGTIEERLTRLGFNQASISIKDSNYIDADSSFTKANSFAQIVYGEFLLKAPATGYDVVLKNDYVIAELTKSLAPITKIKIGAIKQISNTGSSQYPTYQTKITTFYLDVDNKVKINQTKTGGSGFSGSFPIAKDNFFYVIDNLNNAIYYDDLKVYTVAN